MGGRMTPQRATVAPSPAAARPGRERRQSLGQFCAALSDWLPWPYVLAYSRELWALHADGCGPREAAAYARVYLLAPSLVTSDELGGLPDLAAPAAPDAN